MHINIDITYITINLHKTDIVLQVAPGQVHAPAQLLLEFLQQQRHPTSVPPKASDSVGPSLAANRASTISHVNSTYGLNFWCLQILTGH